MGLAGGQHEERLERYILEAVPPFFKRINRLPARPGPLACVCVRSCSGAREARGIVSQVAPKI